MERSNVARFGSVQQKSIQGAHLCTLLAIYGILGRFPGDAYRKMTTEGDVDVHCSSVQPIVVSGK